MLKHQRKDAEEDLPEMPIKGRKSSLLLPLGHPTSAPIPPVGSLS